MLMASISPMHDNLDKVRELSRLPKDVRLTDSEGRLYMIRKWSANIETDRALSITVELLPQDEG